MVPINQHDIINIILLYWDNIIFNSMIIALWVAILTTISRLSLGSKVIPAPGKTIVENKIIIRIYFYFLVDNDN